MKWPDVIVNKQFICSPKFQLDVIKCLSIVIISLVFSFKYLLGRDRNQRSECLGANCLGWCDVSGDEVLLLGIMKVVVHSPALIPNPVFLVCKVDILFYPRQNLVDQKECENEEICPCLYIHWLKAVVMVFDTDYVSSLFDLSRCVIGCSCSWLGSITSQVLLCKYCRLWKKMVYSPMPLRMATTTGWVQSVHFTSLKGGFL